MKPAFFESAEVFRAWLDEHHQAAGELIVGFYKKGSGRPSITWPESVDAALSYGWIDGVRRSVDDISYTIRFTPRKARSTWSRVNIGRVAELTKLGLMRPAGLAAFARRSPEKSGTDSYEQRKAARFDPAHERQFRANPKAWKFFQAQPPGYQRTATGWVVSAKQETTRLRRLATLIKDSGQQRRIGVLARPAKSK